MKPELLLNLIELLITQYNDYFPENDERRMTYNAVASARYELSEQERSKSVIKWNGLKIDNHVKKITMTNKGKDTLVLEDGLFTYNWQTINDGRWVYKAFLAFLWDKQNKIDFAKAMISRQQADMERWMEDTKEPVFKCCNCWYDQVDLKTVQDDYGNFIDKKYCPRCLLEWKSPPYNVEKKQDSASKRIVIPYSKTDWYSDSTAHWKELP